MGPEIFHGHQAVRVAKYRGLTVVGAAAVGRDHSGPHGWRRGWNWRMTADRSPRLPSLRCATTLLLLCFSPQLAVATHPEQLLCGLAINHPVVTECRRGRAFGAGTCS